jgi:hypothetical protein
LSRTSSALQMKIFGYFRTKQKSWKIKETQSINKSFLCTMHVGKTP